MKVTRTLLLSLVLVIPLSLRSSFRSTLYSKVISGQSYDEGSWRNLNVDDGNVALVQRTEFYDDRPLLVLHVGPGKTGTTTVQWFAEHHKQVLNSDNFHYLVQERHELARLCRIQQEVEKCKQKWDEFHRLMEYHHSRKHNVLVSEEGFSSSDDETAEQEFVWDNLVHLQQRWRVRVLFTYRRFFEWIPSKYSQAYNPKGPNKSKREKWPDDGGNVIPSFPAYVDNIMRKEFKHPLTSKRRWDDRFEDVHVFNMHRDGEFLVNFYCDAIPEATRACHYLKKEYSSVTVKNPSSSKLLHFDMIAVAAYKSGLVNKALSRVSVRNAIGEYSKKLGMETVTDFPLECLSRNQTETLLYQSLLMESEMVPEYFSSPRGESELLSGFWKASESGIFCSVDTDKVLHDDRWKDFFTSLVGRAQKRRDRTLN